MANPNHDERGRFSEGDSVTVTGGQNKGKKGVIVKAGTNGAHLVKFHTPAAGGKTHDVVNASHLAKRAETSGESATKANAFKKALSKRDQDIANAKAYEAGTPAERRAVNKFHAVRAAKEKLKRAAEDKANRAAYRLSRRTDGGPP